MSTLHLLKEKIVILVGEYLHSFNQSDIAKDFMAGDGHDEACVDECVQLHQGIDVFYRVDFSDWAGVEIEDHTVGADGHLDQVTVELQPSGARMSGFDRG